MTAANSNATIRVEFICARDCRDEILITHTKTRSGHEHQHHQLLLRLRYFAFRTACPCGSDYWWKRWESCIRVVVDDASQTV